MEQPIAVRDGPYTEEEYLRRAETSDRKLEFRHGRIVAMAGGTHRHGAIAMNLGAAILSRTNCTASGSDVGVRIARTGSYSYPDLSVVCDTPVYHPPEREVVLVNPQVIVEVLSPSTAADDIGEKFDDYMKIESLQEYVLLDQDRPWARSFHRGPEGMWGIGPLVEGIGGTLRLRSLDIGVSLAEIYRNVRFPQPPVSS